MEEIVKHINDTNASYRAMNAGDAKNTDLFLDQEHKSFFKGLKNIRVILHKDNLTKSILFIASILPRKYDRSSEHFKVPFSTSFVYDNILRLEGLFKDRKTFEMDWTIRTDVPQKNGKIDERFYLNGLIHEYTYINKNGVLKTAKFSIRDYLAGGYSDIHFRRTEKADVFDVFVTNTTFYKNEVDGNDEIKDLPFPKQIQQIYYGAPGTGKSHVINKMTQGEDVIRTTFHPDSDYSTFVGAYKPTTKEVVMRDLSGHPIYEGDKELYEDKIVYEFVDQAFLQAYVKAWKYFAEAQDGGEPKKQFLVIEEINRGNCAQIFGDLFQLLDRNDYGFSDYPIQADKDMKKQLAQAFSGLEIASAERINAIYKKDVVSKVLSGEELLLPSNLFIWATMNTSDQSLFPIDSAFKRRWDWQYMPISKGHDDKTGAEINWRIQGETKEYDWWSFLEKINEHIDSTTNSEDKKLGFFFCKAKDNVISSETFVGKVIFYLWNDVFKDYGFDDSIFDDVDGSKLSFNKFYSTDSKGMTVVQKDKVERFLDNLGVDIAGEIDDEEFIDSDSDENGDKNIDDNVDDNVDYNNQGGGNDYSKFSINGSGQYNKGAVVYDAIKMYCDNNPTMSAEDVVAKWLALNVKMPNLVETEAVHEQRRQKGNDPFFDRRSNVLVLKDGTKIFVSTQFTKSRINDLISKVNSKNWGITIAKV